MKIKTKVRYSVNAFDQFSWYIFSIHWNNSLTNAMSMQWRHPISLGCCCWLLLYSAILRSQADSLSSQVILHEWVAFYSTFLNVNQTGVLTALARLVPHETAAISACSVHTIQPCTICHFMQRHICVCLGSHRQAQRRSWPQWSESVGWGPSQWSSQESPSTPALTPPLKPQ